MRKGFVDCIVSVEVVLASMGGDVDEILRFDVHVSHAFLVDLVHSSDHLTKHGRDVGDVWVHLGRGLVAAAGICAELFDDGID